MAEGYRGLLAPWAGGAANDPTPATAVGYRGMLAPWAGGAGSLGGTATAVGFVGLLAFWAGGIANSGEVAPARDLGAHYRAPRVDHEYLDRLKRDELAYLAQQREDEEAVIMAVVQFVLRSA